MGEEPQEHCEFGREEAVVGDENGLAAVVLQRGELVAVVLEGGGLAADVL